MKKLKKFSFYIDITGTTEIIASSEEEAREKITPEMVSRLFNEGYMTTDITFDGKITNEDYNNNNLHQYQED